MIDVTNVDMVKFVQKVYDLSRPQGMGMLHFQPGGITEEEAKVFIDEDGTVSMDYVKGRACKMHTRVKDGRIELGDNWYDHTDAQLSELLEHVGLKHSEGGEPDEHGCSCNCDSCREKRGDGSLDPVEDLKRAMAPGAIKVVPLKIEEE